MDQLNSASLAPQVKTDQTVKGEAPSAGEGAKSTAVTYTFHVQSGKDTTGLKASADYYLLCTTKIQPETDIKQESLTVKTPNPSTTPVPKAAAAPKAPATKPQATKPTASQGAPKG